LKEASSIKKYLDGEYYLKENALKQNFEELASNYDIIHLSTHATAGSYYEPPAIEFYDKTLYLPEIYGYNLQSDLVVLSACESGIGALSKGEGTMSLARGFSYAGVKNLIVSLWKVNDKATELLMAGFYDEFSKTDNKSHSLQNSKLNYLKDENITASKKSPYYWASFIYVGSVDVKEASNYDYWWFIIGIFVIGIAVYLFKKGSFNPK
jgi:CHAT domain-containing protein